jgi:integrase
MSPRVHTIHRHPDDRPGQRGLEDRKAPAGHPARVPAHVRLAYDRRRVNAKALSTYMGHATIGITLDRYGHLMPGNEDEAAGLLDAYLARADTAARLAQLD